MCVWGGWLCVCVAIRVGVGLLKPQDEEIQSKSAASARMFGTLSSSVLHCCQVLLWLKNVKQWKHTHTVLQGCCRACRHCFHICASCLQFSREEVLLSSDSCRGRKGAGSEGSSSWPTHILTLKHHFHNAIYKPLCLFRNSVGSLFTSDSLSRRRGRVAGKKNTLGCWCEEANRSATVTFVQDSLLINYQCDSAAKNTLLKERKCMGPVEQQSCFSCEIIL